METIKFILYSLMRMAIAGVVAFVMGGNILEAGKEINTSPKKYTEVERISFWYHNMNANHLNVSFEVVDDVVDCQYFTPDKKQDKLLELLQSEKIINSPSAFLERIPKEEFEANQVKSLSDLDISQVEVNGAKFFTVKAKKHPIHLEKDQLKALHSLEIIRDNENDIQFLAVNGKTLLGSKSILRKVITIGLGYIVIITGGLAFLLMPFNMYIQVKRHHNQGEPYYIPNKWDSLKNFFDIFRR